jgi:hypothetical protein
MTTAYVQSYIPAEAAAVTPSDTVTNAWSYLYVGTAGNIAVVTEAGQTVVFKNIVAGSYLWIRTSRVNATSTTATDIIGLR